LFLLVEGGYFALLSARKKTVRIKSFSFSFPAPQFSAAQAVLASIDWIFSGTAIYFLLPDKIGITLPGFIGLYMLAQVAGLVSQVPGGLGVFEMVMVLLLPGTVSHSEVVGALLLFRVFYYFLPLTISSLLLGTYELSQRRENVRSLARSIARRITVVTPQVLAFVVFGSGAFLLFSGSLPLVHGRLVFLMDIFPLHVVEISHFLGSLTGVGLILLARALQRRVNAAYYLVMGLTGAGIALSLLKGLKYEEAFLLAVVFVVLLPARREFYRKASIVEERFTPRWVAAVLLVVAGSVWLGIFSYRHVEYTNELWWHFSLKGDAPRFLRASVGALSAVIIFAVARMFRPAKPRPDLPSEEKLDRCSAVIAGFPYVYASLAYLGDKPILFSRSGSAFLMYGVQGRSWISLGDPVGPEEEWEELLWQFRDLADRYNGWTAFYEVDGKSLPFYQRAGLSYFNFGEEGRVELERFSLDGASRKKLRHIRNLLTKEGWTFEIVPREGVEEILAELRRVSNDWLERKGRREMGFSLGRFKESYMKRFPQALVKRGAHVEAFANVLAGGGKEEISVDLMRFSSKAPEGVMEFLFTELMLRGREEGYRWFNLGMVPLSGLEADTSAPVWNRVGTFIYRHGGNFYNFQGLRQFKDKFDPVWETRYLVTPNGFAVPRILVDANILISRGK
jgi:phosphatidylglycerol lysyltransferase